MEICSSLNIKNRQACSQFWRYHFKWLSLLSNLINSVNKNDYYDIIVNDTAIMSRQLKMTQTQ